MANTSNGGSSNNYSFKVVLLGEGCVGKTSLILRYVEDKFNERHITTLQVRMLAYVSLRAITYLVCQAYHYFFLNLCISFLSGFFGVTVVALFFERFFVCLLTDIHGSIPVIILIMKNYYCCITLSTSDFIEKNAISLIRLSFKPN